MLVLSNLNVIHMVSEKNIEVHIVTDIKVKYTTTRQRGLTDRASDSYSEGRGFKPIAGHTWECVCKPVPRVDQCHVREIW